MILETNSREALIATDEEGLAQALTDMPKELWFGLKDLTLVFVDGSSFEIHYADGLATALWKKPTENKGDE